MSFFKIEVTHSFKQASLVISITSLMMTGCNTLPNNNVQDSKPLINNDAINFNGNVTNNNLDVKNFNKYSVQNDLSSLFNRTRMPRVNDEKDLIAKFGNIWHSMRSGYRLELPQNSVGFNESSFIENQHWFIRNGRYIDDVTSRASRYIYYTVNEAIFNNVPTEIALLPMIDSSYDPFVSNVQTGESGLWQLNEKVVSSYGYRSSAEFDPRKDVILSTKIAYKELVKFNNMFGSWELAIAAKHSGEEVVRRAIDKNKAANISTDFWSLDLPSATKNYVARFWAIVDIVKNPQMHRVFLPAIANSSYFRAEKSPIGTELATVMSESNIPFNELIYLNPGLSKQTVLAGSPNSILIPKASKHINYHSPYSKNVEQDNTSTGSVQGSHEPTGPLVQNQSKYNSDNALGQNTETNRNASENMPNNPYKQFKAPNEQGRQAVVSNNGDIERKSIPASGFYIVKGGNTLYGTAIKFGVKASDIIAYNKLLSNTLIPGQKLWLRKNKNSSRAVVATKPTSRKSGTYKVKSGDSLLGVAYRLGVTPSQLAVANNLTVHSNLLIGDILNIPTKNNSKSESNRNTSGINKNRVNKIENRVSNRKNNQPSLRTSRNRAIIRYRVKPYDTLTSLAQLSNTTVPYLIRINNVNGGLNVTPGEYIYLPKN